MCLALGLPPALGCGGGPSSSSSIEKALEAPKKEAPAKAAGKPKEKPAPDPNAAPWTVDAIRTAMTVGTKVSWSRSGTDAKGKKVGGTLTYAIAKAGDDGVTTTYTIDPDPGTNAASSQLATAPWSTLGPFFAMEKPTVTVEGRESVTVPAGTFECSRARMQDFFGNQKTVWMIIDKPGVLAKIEDAGNAGDDADKTAIVYELVALPAG